MLLVDVVGPETRRCRSVWQCVYLVPIDAVDFPTIQKIMLELHKLASIAPSEAFVLVLVNYMHLKVSQHVAEEAARKAWTAFFFKMQEKAGTQNSHSWRVLGVAPEGVAVVSLRATSDQIEISDMRVSEPPPRIGAVNFGTVLIYLEVHLKCADGDQVTGITWAPTLTQESSLAKHGCTLTEVQMQAASTMVFSLVALKLEYGDEPEHMPSEALAVAGATLFARLDGFISLLHVRDTYTSSTSIHTWHAAGRLRASVGSLHNTGFIPYPTGERFQMPPVCYRIQGRKRVGVFPLAHRLNLDAFPAAWCKSVGRDSSSTVGGSSSSTRTSTNSSSMAGSSDDPAAHIGEHEAPAGFMLSPASAGVSETGEESAKASMSDEDECETDCVICWERRACFVMDRCGHLVFCAKCRQVSCKARDLKNRNVTSFHPSRMTMVKIQSIAIDCPICRRTSKTSHINDYGGAIYCC